MDTDPVIEMLGRPLCLAVIGGGPGSFIGAMHESDPDPADGLPWRYDPARRGAVAGDERHQNSRPLMTLAAES